MRQIEFKLDRAIITARYDSALLVHDDEDPAEALVEAVIRSISTDVEITAGGVTMHLAAYQDPEHWESDWAEKGIDDPRAFIARLVGVYERS